MKRHGISRCRAMDQVFQEGKYPFPRYGTASHKEVRTNTSQSLTKQPCTLRQNESTNQRSCKPMEAHACTQTGKGEHRNRPNQDTSNVAVVLVVVIIQLLWSHILKVQPGSGIFHFVIWAMKPGLCLAVVEIFELCSKYCGKLFSNKGRACPIPNHIQTMSHICACVKGEVSG